jgi:hypothetical protein
VAKTSRLAQDEGTFKIFGGVDEQGSLDKHSIRESMEDEATLPIRHTMAPSEHSSGVRRCNPEWKNICIVANSIVSNRQARYDGLHQV